MGAAKRRREANPDTYGQPDIWQARIFDQQGIIAEIPYTVPRHRGAAPAVAILLMSALQEPDLEANWRRLARAIGEDGAAAVGELLRDLPEHFWLEVWQGEHLHGAAFSSREAYAQSGHTGEELEAVVPERVVRAAGVAR